MPQSGNTLNGEKEETFYWNTIFIWNMERKRFCMLKCQLFVELEDDCKCSVVFYGNFPSI